MGKIFSLLLVFGVIIHVSSAPRKKANSGGPNEPTHDTPSGYKFVLRNESSDGNSRASFGKCKEDFGGKPFGPIGEFCAVPIEIVLSSL